MKIDSGMVGMESARISTSATWMSTVRIATTGDTQKTTVFGTLVDQNKTNRNGRRNAFMEQGEAQNMTGDTSLEDDQVEEDQNAQKEKNKLLSDQLMTLTNARKVMPSKLEEDNLATVKMRCLMYLLALLFPERYGDSWKSPNEWVQELSAEASGSSTFVAQPTITTVQSITQYCHEETETTGFQTTGTVLTEDGRAISFQLDLEMSRSFREYYEERYDREIVSYCDPLVINLNTGAASLEDQKFFFDLDGDGTEEQIAKLCEDSGYLALDRNENGQIDDGTELFGTSSGNGFADLMAYDEDQNGWIDENDDIFDKLKIWVQKEDGSSQLYSLKEQNVGAIYLGSAGTEFKLTNALGDQELGMVRRTGMFLYENGTAGTLQQIDLAT